MKEVYDWMWKHPTHYELYIFFHKKEEEEEGEEAGSPHTCTSGHIFRRRRGGVSQQRDRGPIDEQTPPKETVGPDRWCLCG